MKYNISDNKMRVIVEVLGEEYKDLLIERILDDTNETDVDQINASDLIRLDVTTKSNLRVDKKIQRRNSMNSIISLLGILYALLGLMLMMLSEFRYTIRHNSMTLVAFTLIFIGLFVTIFSLMYKYFLKVRIGYYRGRMHTITPYQVINKWKEIEALVNELTPQENEFSLVSMIENLKETKIISQEDVEIMNRLLCFRNQIVHGEGNKFDLSQAELRTLFLQADKIISKMKKIV